MTATGPAVRPIVVPTEPRTPVRVRPFPSWPHFEPDEIEAVAKVLQSGKVNYWTGEQGHKFEQEFAEVAGCKHAVALANGTVALELALKTCSIGAGDEVIVTSRTFVASASCIVACGATPVFADVDHDSGNITADTIRAVVSSRTRAIIAVHLAGWPCDMDPILGLAEQADLVVIEDCAQSHGATYKGRPVGSLGHAAAFSFCQDKIMTTAGEGGMLTTNDPGIWNLAWSYKDHGKSYQAVYERNHSPGFRWLHESFGTNGRMTEVQAAVGRVQLRKLSAWTANRRRHAAILNACVSKLQAFRAAMPAAEIGHAYYKFYCYVRPERLRPNWSRDLIMSAITNEGVPCFSGTCSEIYLEKAFPESMRPPERLQVARELGETSLMFMVHPTITDEDMRDTCRAVEKVMTKATQ